MTTSSSSENDPAAQPLEQRARQIFGDLLPIEPGRREQALAEACAGDAALKGRVLQLLASYEQAQAEGLLGDPTAEVSTTVPAGTTIGRFKLLEVIGEGGFGTVYMAEQLAPVQRRVALKII